MSMTDHSTDSQCLVSDLFTSHTVLLVAFRIAGALCFSTVLTRRYTESVCNGRVLCCRVCIYFALSVLFTLDYCS